MRRSEPARASLKARLAGMTKRRQVVCSLWPVVAARDSWCVLSSPRVRGTSFVVRGEGDGDGPQRVTRGGHGGDIVLAVRAAWTPDLGVQAASSGESGKSGKWRVACGMWKPILCPFPRPTSHLLHPFTTYHVLPLPGLSEQRIGKFHLGARSSYPITEWPPGCATRPDRGSGRIPR